MCKLPFYERRRRLRRPWPLFLAGILCLVWPLINFPYLVQSVTLILSAHAWQMRLIAGTQISFFVFPVFAGVGLLRIKKWGWLLLLIYCAFLILHNGVLLILSPVSHNVNALIQVVAGIMCVLYLIRRDISAPFMKVYPRGWRFEKRTPVSTEVQLDGVAFKTTDMSLRGLYASSSDAQWKIGQEVRIGFSMAEGPLALRGVVVRIDEEGVGIAYRGVNGSDRARLRSLIS